MSVFLWYENPLMSLCQKKICSKLKCKTELKQSIDRIKYNSQILGRELDLKRILAHIYNFDAHINQMLDKLRMPKGKIFDEYTLMKK